MHIVPATSASSWLPAFGKGRGADPRYVEGVLNFKCPTTKEEVQRFIGLVGFYSKFTRKLCYRVAPIRRHAKLGGFQGWNSTNQPAFEELRNVLLTPPVLHNSDWTGATTGTQREMRLTTDYSKTGMGAVLMMLFEDGWPPICYSSRSTTAVEARVLDTASGKACELIWALGKLRPYFARRRLQVLTDHADL